MEAKGKKKMTLRGKKKVYDLDYKSTTEMFLERMRCDNPKDGEDAAGFWLYEFDENRMYEAERLNVILPVIKYCTEREMLTDMLKDELDWYYNEYQEGRLDFLAPAEADVVLKDLLWCYHKVFD